MKTKRETRTKLRFATIGAGFWARFQLHGWQTTGGADCVAICDRNRDKAEEYAQLFDIPAVYEDAEEMLRNERLDFVDVVTGVETHGQLVMMAKAHKRAVICQKPMGCSLEESEKMVRACRKAGVPFYVNENWRWQTPVRKISELLKANKIGRPFRAKISMVSGFPVFDNQPFLRELEKFVLTDVGSHVLDVARFLFGEARTVYCQTKRIHSEIRGEDVATVMLETKQDVTVIVEMGYAGNYLERDKFPETCIFIEGENGSLELTHGFGIRLTTKEGTLVRRAIPPKFAWADTNYGIVHSSIVPCQQNLLAALRGETKAETDAEDNLKTMQLVYACYSSARSGQTISL